MGIIYIIKNLINHKIYIGQTTRTLKKRWKDHINEYKYSSKNDEIEKVLYHAFKLHGIENFVIFQIKECSDEELDDFEIFYIKTYSAMVPCGYNVRTGGSSGKHSEESKEKMRQSKLGSKNHNFGKPRTDETKELISLAVSGENHHYYGKTLSDEHSNNLSISHKKGGLSEGLPKYMVYVKARPDQYQSDGYAIVNNPMLANKYFTQKKLTLQEKYELAHNYLYQTKPD